MASEDKEEEESRTLSCSALNVIPTEEEINRVVWNRHASAFLRFPGHSSKSEHSVREHPLTTALVLSLL